MRTRTSILFVILINISYIACANKTEHKHSHDEEVLDEIQALQIKNLLRDSLGLQEDIEIIVSHLEVPKKTSLPTHYHPGEEFVYVLQGSGELFLDGAPKKLVKAGDVVKVPLKKIHNFSTLDEGAKAIVFRVHEKGQPDRILIDNNNSKHE